MTGTSKKNFIVRLIVCTFFCLTLHPTPAYAVWDYSLAAQIAFNDVFRSTCGKIETRLNAVLKNELEKIVQHDGIKAVSSARRSQEYFSVYRQVLFEYLKHGWGDAEEEAHHCEEVFLDLNTKGDNTSRWWRDRSCAGVALDSEDGRRCMASPRALISFSNTMADSEISILRIAPSSDVSFPRAGTYPHHVDTATTLVDTNYVPGVWAVPDSVEFEWKEWPRTFRGEPKSNEDLKNLRSYAEKVRATVQRKRRLIILRDHIPSQVITDVSQAEQGAKAEQAAERSLKLFFIFMKDGLRFRWEQWHGECIEKYGGDQIDLPNDQLLSSSYVCVEPRAVEPAR